MPAARLVLLALLAAPAACLDFPDCVETGCDPGLVCGADGLCRAPGGDAGPGPGALRVLSTDPAPNSLEGDAELVTVTFSAPMARPSAATMKVRSAALGALEGTYAVDGRTVSFAPFRQPPAGDRVEVVVRSLLESASGERLGQSYTFAFRVESGSASGTLTSIATRVFGRGSFRRIRVADLGGDGRLDLLAAASGVVHVIGLWPSGELEADTLEVGSNLADFAVADFDQDGILDIFGGGGPLTARSLPFLGDGRGFSGCCVVTELDVSVHRIETADLDGDGIPDLLGVYRRFGVAEDAQSEGKNGFIAINAGNARFTVRDLDSGAPGETADIAAEDMNGDGLLDLVLVNDQTTRGPGVVTVHFGEGGGRFAAPVRTEATMDGEVVDAFTTGDFDGDGDVDVVVGARVSETFELLLNDGTGRLEPGLRRPAGVDALTSGDLNGDGQLDVVGVGAQVYGNVAMGTEFVPIGSGGEGGTEALTVVDIDGDGDVDVLGGAGGAETSLTILRND